MVVTLVQLVSFLLLPTHDGSQFHGGTERWKENFSVVRQVGIAAEETNTPHCGLSAEGRDLCISRRNQSKNCQFSEIKTKSTQKSKRDGASGKKCDIIIRWIDENPHESHFTRISTYARLNQVSVAAKANRNHRLPSIITFRFGFFSSTESTNSERHSIY